MKRLAYAILLSASLTVPSNAADPVPQPRGYSILAYGESPNPASPYHADQAAMFARGQLKRIAWSDQEIEAQTIKRYHPGERP